ncbi:response regulator [Leptolyngbya sp. NK1-12]|uniref:Response regulator n=1 Tax=Leptolyngbya sp. NK1-12 TaxID=2547451 RepID=A0AA96WD08_9CYAN|nr:response regulator [Leptolyngbya sp. NK1-12]WNZ22973.1 response regulator [Leptolyngbya sp. NK1-12]
MTVKSYEPLLVAEDSDEDFVTLQRLMQRMKVQNPIYRCADGDSVLDFLQQVGESEESDRALPSVILLDLNLPGTDGRDVLAQLKQDQSLREIPIVVFTTSSNPKDIEFCYQNGANGYLIKPMDARELQRTIQAFVDYWLEANMPPIQPSQS